MIPFNLYLTYLFLLADSVKIAFLDQESLCASVNSFFFVFPPIIFFQACQIDLHRSIQKSPKVFFLLVLKSSQDKNQETRQIT